MQAKLLLIEDTVELGSCIQEFLELKGYEVDRAQDGPSGLEQAKTYYYDCILLDVMLPGMDGFAVLQEVRKQRKIPVIMTTAKGELDDKKQGYVQGADDYLVKPFDLEELDLRLQAIIKRTKVADMVRRGDIEIFLDENRVCKGGKEVSLTQTEFAVLALLVEAEGRTIQKSVLLDELRGEDALRSDSGKVDVHLFNLRRKLDKEIIVTVKGVGYRFNVQQ